MPVLTVQNAEIKTATVEVKTLTISGKQVTQSVFRQLEQGALIAADWTFRGIPWGRVNYHPDPGCKRTGPHTQYYDQTAYCLADHMHVVWQQGSELRRTFVWGRCDCRRWYERQERLAEVYTTLLDLPQLFIAV
jgi:hypothetical protein